MIKCVIHDDAIYRIARRRSTSGIIFTKVHLHQARLSGIPRRGGDSSKVGRKVGYDKSRPSENLDVKRRRVGGMEKEQTDGGFELNDVLSLVYFTRVGKLVYSNRKNVSRERNKFHLCIEFDGNMTDRDRYSSVFRSLMD